MKSKSKIIRVLFCIYLVLIKVISRLELKFEIDFYVFFVAFVMCVCCICFIPKRIIGILSAALVTVGVSIYNYEYCIYALPVALLVLAHKEALSETKKTNKIKSANRLSEMCSVLSAFSLVLQLVYAQKNRRYGENLDTIGELGITVCVLIFFVLLFVVSFNKVGTYQKVIKKDIAIKFRLVYIVAIIGIIAMVYTLMLKENSKTIQHDIAHVYWFVFFMEVAFNEDPFLDELINRFGMLASRDKSKKVVKK